MDFEVFLGYFSGLRFLDETITFSTLIGTALFLHLLDGIICGLIAKKEGRSLCLWIIVGALFGVWALTALLLRIAQGKDRGRGLTPSR